LRQRPASTTALDGDGGGTGRGGARTAPERAALDGPGADSHGQRAQRRQSWSTQGWADCQRLLIHDWTGFTPRSDWADPEGLTADVTIGLRPSAGSTEVTVVPRYAASYRDIFRNLPIMGACPSSGVLEQRLLGAARG
jgi:hypothetical protein